MQIEINKYLFQVGETTKDLPLQELQLEMSKITQQTGNVVEMKVEKTVDRFIGVDHLPDFDNNKSASRCFRCRKTTHIICPKCEKNLCFVKGRNCFKEYHTEEN